MRYSEAMLRLKGHFMIHNDGRPTPYLDEAARMAYEALEKQIPKKPIPYDKGWSGVTLYKCPVCNGLLGAKSFNEEQNLIGCARCLSAIDWSEVE